MREEYSTIPNFRFMLRVDGAFNVPLKSVQAFTRENEYDYIQEGGMNDYVYMRRKPISKPYTLRVERYITTDFNDPLSNGTELFLPLLLFVGKNTGGGMDFARYYAFTGAVVMSKEYGALDAERAGLLTESITIGYNQMFCITNPADSTDKPPWSIEGSDDSGDENSAGNHSRLYSVSPAEPMQNQMSKDSFVKAAYKWGFSGKSKAGNEKTMHVVAPNDSTKKDMIESKNRRHFNFAANANPAGVTDTNSKKSAQNAAYSDKALGEKFGIKELTTKEMAAKARKFEFDGNAPAGNGTLSSPHLIEANKNAKSSFTDGAQKWEFDETKKAGNGVNSAQNSLVTEHSTAPDGSSIGLGRPEATKEEMAEKASKREFGGVNDPQKDKFAGSAKKWKFDEQKKEGSGDRSRQNAMGDGGPNGQVSGFGVTEVSKEEMMEISHRWAFGSDKYSVKGNDVRSASTDTEATGRSGFEENAKLWRFDGLTKQGAGDSSRDVSRVKEASKSEMAQAASRGKTSGKGSGQSIADFLMT